ncbi:MAG: phosphomannomutase/phosphoglucomutase, partial [Wenzhouxiangellaceae bacterium]
MEERPIVPESAEEPASEAPEDILTSALSAQPDAPEAVDEDEDDEINRMLAALVDDDGDDAAVDDDAIEQAPPPAQPDPVPDKPVAAAESTGLPPASIFRAYDIRGVVGDTLSPKIAEAIGRAVGSEARDAGLSRIAVARDGRLSGAEMLAALIRGLTACGMEVIEVGAVPTPVLYYAAQELAGGSGVMVTGSHNPPDYNGFKIVLGGETLSGERIQGLYQRLVDGALIDGQGEVRQEQIVPRYMERIGTDIQLEKPLKVVVDCGNGIAGAIAPKLLESIGAEVIPLYAEVDGTFPNHHPDPGDPETLEDLKLCVRNFNADVGVAFDGDGDRLGVVAPDGEIIYPDRIMMLFARDVLSRNPGQPIIFDVKCSSLLAVEIEKAGGKPIMARTGHSFIKKQLKDDKAAFAGEMSGHFFFSERWYGFDDGIYAAARLLEILAADTRATGQILAELPKAVSTPELKVEMKEGEPHPFVASFKYAAEFEGATLNTIDGVRADFEDGFGLVRASNTTPVLVCRFEGKDATALERIKNQFREAMLKINPALKLP